MPRAEIGSQKWLSNKMKSKGLQKLKWYCQMCEKQCRDENGFKCHRLSEGHQRQMQIFCQNAGRFMDRFSKTFEHEFMKLMRTRYCKTKIMANTVYQELISDKQHVHMNATVWVTLSEFVLYLGRSGKCKVEHTPKGWVLEYIDVDKIRRQQDEEARRKREITLEQKHQRIIQQLIDDAKTRGGYKEPEYTPMIRDEHKKISISANFLSKSDKPTPSDMNVFKQYCKNIKGKNDNASKVGKNDMLSESDDSCFIKRKAALDSILDGFKKQKGCTTEDNNKNPKNNHDEVICTDLKDFKCANTLKYITDKNENWLCDNILVKIILESHPSYKKRCKVMSVIDGKRAILQDPNNNCRTIELNDNYLETVIPPVDSLVKMLRGVYKGNLGTLKSADPDNLSATILIKGILLTNVSYDDFSTFVPL